MHRTPRTLLGALLMLAVAAIVVQSTSLCWAQAPAAPQHAPARTPAKTSADPAIAAALKDISPTHIKATIEKLVSFGTRLTISATDDEAVRSGRGAGAAREWIKSEFERYSAACGGCLEVKTDSYYQGVTSRVPHETEITNVYAVMKGTDPDSAQRIYLVTGHYDSRPSNPEDEKADAPGANDDGSGTAVSLECARVLSKHKFPATIIFLTVAGEEQGLLGAAHFAKMAREQGWQLQAVLNNDIVGGDKSPGQNPKVVRVFSEGIPDPAVGNEQEIRRIRGLGEESDSPSRELARYIRETAKQYMPATFGPRMILRPDRYLRGGDHTAFNQQGFAAVRFTEFRENYKHQHQTPRTESGIEYGDLAKYVDFDYVANVARLNAAVLASLASAPAPPANVRLETRGLENNSTLMWDASPGGLAKSYEVVWRDTTAPEWENIDEAGSATQITLDRSKDNVFFAVRAVDAHGHRSLPVIPKPER